MSRLATSFVLGYYGCDKATARKAVLEGAPILHSNRDYDWLGPGLTLVTIPILLLLPARHMGFPWGWGGA